MSGMRFLPVNAGAMLVELADLQQTLSLLQALQAEPIDGVLELIPAAKTILVQFAPQRIAPADLVQAIAGRDLSTEVQRSDRLIEIPVHYMGEDLAEVAELLGISVAEVIERHTGSDWSVAFTGFAPGFAYLTGGDPIFDLPRRSSPRTKVPAGAVALAGTFSAVYPQESPGGWQLIGVTELPMWDLSRLVPALLQPGFRVRFVDAARSLASLPVSAPAVAPVPVAPGGASGLRVIATGLQTIYQDRGRHGQAGQGVSASGAMDQSAFKTANRLVGNASDSPVLETVGGGLALLSLGANVLAVTGAEAELTLTSAAGHSWRVERYRPLALADGDVLRIGQPQSGARCYVAVRGGYQVQPVLGSAATDTLAKVGPAALCSGQHLGVLPPGNRPVGAPQLPPEGLPRTGAEVVLDVEMGPRTDWFTPEAVALFAAQRWQVSPQSNRVGLRLAGEQPLTRRLAMELPSEGTPLGAIQVPANGQPVLFLADHPLTGGYPVIGCVAAHHLDLAGQIPVGAWIRFRPLQPFAELRPAA